MYRNRASSPPPYSHLRRRYQAVNDRQRSNCRSSTYDSNQDVSDRLDLSIHLPGRPSENRFDVLRSPPPDPKPNRDYNVASYVRRSRHNRGSREAKRRRDARRNQRKYHGAQMLDEQLSRDIDKTLTQANIRRLLPQQLFHSTRPIHVPPTPPQLPYLNFGGLDLMDDLLPLTPRKDISRPHTPVSPPLTIPSWCPPLPSLVNGNPNWSEYPIFFDLSSLPEPKGPLRGNNECHDLQSWRPKASPQPRKQSRFFPPLSAPKPSVRLPRARSKLHAADAGPEDVGIAKPKSLAESIEHVVKAAESAAKIRKDEEATSSAANLWRILTSPEQPARSSGKAPYINSSAYQPTDCVAAMRYGTYDHWLESVGMPFELDNTEIPFAHRNSLIGHANERGSEPTPVSEGDVIVFESPKAKAPVQEMIYGINELVVDSYDEGEYTDALLAHLNLPPLPPSPELILSESVVTGGKTHDNSLHNASVVENELSMSDAHFNSEQALFELTSPECLKGADQDIIDVATFLTMGHSDNCWCNDCGEPPELVSPNEWIEDDEWMVYSSDEEVRSPSVVSDWEWDWGTVGGAEEKEAAWYSWSSQPGWDDMHSYKPSSVAHTAW
ncbi:hypothetical protein LTR37_001290 [Vermiconidia calcicola]|uniref:Uncharacterized protein n=1 Tax=Vermiconidia calcicola TaxID=1690605 RepID=A0ACC3NYW7_9PEZI|nr:hypothetical protein LTR37_001290 [Vermiconidia calcicola]